MISDKIIILNDLNRLFYLRHDEMILDLEHFYSEFLSKRIAFEQFWLNNREDIKNVFYTYYNMEYYDSKSLFIKFFSNYIDEKFAENMVLTKSFVDFTFHNSSFNTYFQWLKKYILEFFIKYNLNHYHGICDYETEIEDPDRKIIKVKINLPIDDFDHILDLLESFIEEVEIFLTHKAPSLIPYFKRSYFIFRSFNDDVS
ncbi:hypothetical protein LCGC14_1277540 [marine sediment metagenome]|uniref:Uncharacterized protein n=1 Tax=marine sediment metagenome TaxID=412755 RepID=A0A0F9NZ94_9ZZZZ|nr:hypothetical protein [bacterium]